MLQVIGKVIGIVFVVCSLGTMAIELIQSTAIVLRIIGLIIGLAFLVMVVFLIKAVIDFFS